MADMKPWQVYTRNGQPIAGVGAAPDEFDSDPAKIKAASHVWIWRRREDSFEIALQKRSFDTTTWEGYLDITTAGHIDLGETPLQAALREATEEIGYTLDPDRLIWLLSCWAETNSSEIDYVYTYRHDESQQFAFNDGEVEAVTWYSLEDFRAMTKNPQANNLVPQGDHYFARLIVYIESQ